MHKKNVNNCFIVVYNSLWAFYVECPQTGEETGFSVG